MPTFYTDDLDISVDEFLSACSPRDRKELIKSLREDGYLNESSSSRVTIMEQDLQNNCKIISNSYSRISLEDEKTIESISKKYTV